MYVCAHRFCGLRIRTERSRESLFRLTMPWPPPYNLKQKRGIIWKYGFTQQVLDRSYLLVVPHLGPLHSLSSPVNSGIFIHGLYFIDFWGLFSWTYPFCNYLILHMISLILTVFLLACLVNPCIKVMLHKSTWDIYLISCFLLRLCGSVFTEFLNTWTSRSRLFSCYFFNLSF